jgi:hypothetical protein
MVYIFTFWCTYMNDAFSVHSSVLQHSYITCQQFPFECQLQFFILPKRHISLNTEEHQLSKFISDKHGLYNWVTGLNPYK